MHHIQGKGPLPSPVFIPPQTACLVPYCRGLGMLFSNVTFPLEDSKPCTSCWLSFPSPWRAGENWRHKRSRSWAEIRTVYWKQQWDKKLAITATILITEHTRDEWFTPESSPRGTQIHTHNSPPSTWPGGTPSPLQPLKMTWGDTEKPQCPGHVPLGYCQERLPESRHMRLWLIWELAVTTVSTCEASTISMHLILAEILWDIL